MNKIEDARVTQALMMLADATGLHGDREAVRAALTKLFRWTPEMTPKQFSPKARTGYEKGDEEAPFFSEAYLYVLLGKDDARTLLSMMNRLCEAIGFDRTEQSKLYADPEKEPRLLIVTGPLRGQVIVCLDEEARYQLRRSLEWTTGIHAWSLRANDTVEDVLAKYDAHEAKQKARRPQ